MPMRCFFLLITAIFLFVSAGDIPAQEKGPPMKGTMTPVIQEGKIVTSDGEPQGDTARASQEPPAKDSTGDSGRAYLFGATWYIAITILILMVFILIPFLPGMKELFRPKDEKPLALNINFSKDYKYFGRSFQKILENGLGTKKITEPGEYTLFLSKPEKVRVVARERAEGNKTTDEILYVLGDFSSGNRAEFRKEIYVKGSCDIGERNTLRALYCEGDLVIGKGTVVIRWVDGDRDIEVKEGCRLGMSVVSPQRLDVAHDCSFSRMFGLPITTYQAQPPSIPRDIQVKNISDTTMVITKEEIIMPPLTTIPRDLVTHQRVVLREKSFAKASIKSYRDIIIEQGSRIEGNLFSEGDVIIGAGCIILGNVFSQGRVEIGNGVHVGEKGQIKSVIGKKGVFLKGNVALYGYLMTEGEGKVL